MVVRDRQETHALIDQHQDLTDSSTAINITANNDDQLLMKMSRAGTVCNAVQQGVFSRRITNIGTTAGFMIFVFLDK